MSKTFDFRGNLKRARFENIDSTADKLVEVAGDAEDVSSDGIEHRPPSEQNDDDDDAHPRARLVRRGLMNPWTVAIGGAVIGGYLILLLAHVV